MIELPTLDVRRDLSWTEAKIKTFLGRQAKLAGDVGRVQEESCVVREGGAVKIVYLAGPVGGLDRLESALGEIDYHEHFRTSGMKVVSRTFGFAPRIAMRQDYCAASVLAVEAPEAHAEVCAGAAVAERYYRAYNPTLYARHREAVSALEVSGRRLRPEYRLDGGVFTSGIINSNNLLPYHFDRGNVENVWSAMLVFKRNVVGGFLACPQYDLAFALPDRSLFMFDGQGLLHGVTPFVCAVHGEKALMGHSAWNEREPHACKEAWRYSVVFYTLRGMWQCMDTAGEVERVQGQMWERAKKR